MGKVIRFRSLAKPNIVYTAHQSSTDLWDQTYRRTPLANWAGAYDTYGDGDVQHTPEWAVIRDDFGDYCASLAAYLLDHFEDAEVVSGHFREGISTERLHFALKLRHNPDKRRWYNRNECKVSASDSKRHDKRWEEVPEWADGSFAALLRITSAEYPDLLSAYQTATLIREWLWTLPQDDRPCVPTLHDHFRIAGDRTTDRQAYDALHAIVKAWQAREAARGQLECRQSNLEYQAARQVEAAQAAQQTTGDEQPASVAG